MSEDPLVSAVGLKLPTLRFPPSQLNLIDDDVFLLSADQDQDLNA
jgi:hypothetical protein